MCWSSIINAVPKMAPKKLLIPGPVNTRFNQIVDLAPREKPSMCMIQSLRKNLLDIYKLSSKKYTTVLIPGSGTMCNEAVMRSFPRFVSADILSNGTYGERLIEISKYLDLQNNYFYFDEKEQIKLKDDHSKGQIVSMVHHETGTGIRNNIEEILDIYPNETITHIDAISTFGGIPFELEKHNVDFFVGSANKCLHSFAGLSFVICKKSTLEKFKNVNSSLSLNLYHEWKYMDETNQFRFTPPMQLVNYLNQATRDLLNSGGIEKRYSEYKKLNKIVRDNLGDVLEEVVPNHDYLMTLYKHPDPEFDFQEFKEKLRTKNIIVQDSVIFDKNLIRIGNIGEWTEKEMSETMKTLKKYL